MFMGVASKSTFRFSMSVFAIPGISITTTFLMKRMAHTKSEIQIRILLYQVQEKPSDHQI